MTVYECACVCAHVFVCAWWVSEEAKVLMSDLPYK